LSSGQIEHQFAMAPGSTAELRVHRTASIRLGVTPCQANRCYGLLRSGGDVWAWQNWRLRQWRRTHLTQALFDKARLAGIQVRLVDERGTSSTCVACRRRVPKSGTRRFRCPYCKYNAHRDLVGAANIAAKVGGGGSSAALPAHVEHRRVGIVPARRDRRRHLHDNGGDSPAWPRATCVRTLALAGVARRTQHSPASGEDQAALPIRGIRFLKGH
jgi:Putative transposase DNA-binding domain